jgi:hypothetical protein
MSRHTVAAAEGTEKPPKARLLKTSPLPPSREDSRRQAKSRDSELGSMAGQTDLFPPRGDPPPDNRPKGRRSTREADTFEARICYCVIRYSGHAARESGTPARQVHVQSSRCPTRALKNLLTMFERRCCITMCCACIVLCCIFTRRTGPHF